MSEDIHPYERIEQYIAGTLSPEAKAAFEVQMTKDDNLSKDVALHHDLQNALIDEEVIELEELLIKLRAGGQKQTNIKPLWARKPFLSIAATILFICVLAFLFWPQSKQSDYVAYFDTYPLYLATRSADASYEQQLNLLNQFYPKGDYKQALASLNQLRQNKPEDRAFRFYQAYCQYQLGLLHEAESAFKNILSEGDSAYLSPTEWYLVDVYIKQDKLDQAIELLKQIQANNGDYSTLATQLLNDLN